MIVYHFLSNVPSHFRQCESLACKTRILKPQPGGLNNKEDVLQWLFNMGVHIGKAIDGWQACAFTLFQHEGLPGRPAYCWWIYLSNTHSLIINASSRSVCLPHIIARYNINHWATDTTLYNMARTKAPWVIHYSYQLQWIPHEMGLVSCVNAQTSSDPKSYSLNWYITLLAGKDSSV